MTATLTKPLIPNGHGTLVERKITLPTIPVDEMIVVIEGETPLITNRFSEEAMDAIAGSQGQEAKLKKEARNPQAEFLAARYLLSGPDEPERYGIPAVGMKKALVAAGGRFADQKMTELRGAFFVIGEGKNDLLEILTDGPPEMRRDRVRIGMGKTSLAYRPEYDPWTIQARVRYNRSAITQEQVLNLFQICGFAIGLGEWRPENNGPYGRFRLVEAKALELQP